jgi:hypothetical protein
MRRFILILALAAPLLAIGGAPRVAECAAVGGCGVGSCGPGACQPGCGCVIIPGERSFCAPVR